MNNHLKKKIKNKLSLMFNKTAMSCRNMLYTEEIKHSVNCWVFYMQYGRNGCEHFLKSKKKILCSKRSKSMDNLDLIDKDISLKKTFSMNELSNKYSFNSRFCDIDDIGIIKECFY